jgi:hypothetical protein
MALAHIPTRRHLAAQRASTCPRHLANGHVYDARDARDIPPQSLEAVLKLVSWEWAPACLAPLPGMHLPMAMILWASLMWVTE